MSEPQTDYASSLRAYEIVMLVTPIVAVILRFWGRTLGASSKGPKYWWDDWVCLMALVRGKRIPPSGFYDLGKTCLHHVCVRQPLSVASNCLELYLIDLGFGRHLKVRKIHLILRLTRTHVVGMS